MPIDPNETKTMEDEYEYLTADTAENCKKIVDWVFAGECEKKTTSISRAFGYHVLSVVWISADRVIRNSEYRRKKPAAPPKKFKKLVDRTREDFRELLGIAFWRSKSSEAPEMLVTSAIAHVQDQYEISLDRGKTWGPMQKTVEVDA